MMADDDANVTLAQAVAQLTADQRFAVVFERGDDVTVEIFVPRGRDTQQPHDRDELYIVVSGTGNFRRGDTIVAFGPGDLLHAPAHVPHRFEAFSEDFTVWVIFYGPKRPKE